MNKHEHSRSDAWPRAIATTAILALAAAGILSIGVGLGAPPPVLVVLTGLGLALGVELATWHRLGARLRRRRHNSAVSRAQYWRNYWNSLAANADDSADQEDAEDLASQYTLELQRLLSQRPTN